MPRHLSMFVAVAGLCAAVAIVARLPRPANHRDASISASTDVSISAPTAALDQGRELEDVASDPTAAVATILELRSQFGSVLADSELEMVQPSGHFGEGEGGPRSFDDFVWAAAGVVLPPTSKVDAGAAVASQVEVGPELDPQLSTIEAASLLAANQELAEAMRGMATLLVARAEQVRAVGETAQQQRLAGLAMLLRAEADGLAEDATVGADQPIR